MRPIHLSLICLCFVSCSKEIINSKDYTYSTPVEQNDDIHVKSIQASNIDTTLIFKLNKDIIDKQLCNVHSILIYKDGALFYEKYLCGKDEKRGKNLGIVKHDINVLHDVRSISKSVVSACIGIAIKKGLIKDVNEPVKNYFSGDCGGDDEKGNISLKNLLTMSSGLCWEEIGNHSGLFDDETKMDLSFHPIGFVLNKEMVSDAGTTWNYSGGNTQLLAEIIRKVSGKNIVEFAQENLFQPLGIQKTEWTRLTLSKIPAAASGLRLTSRDLLKIGLLYKNNGTYNGIQVLDSNWVKNTMATHIVRPDLKHLNLEDGGYGFQFWTYSFTLKNRMVNMVEAKGNGGQSIFICKDVNMVVVITAGNYGKKEYNNIPYKVLNDYILPSIR